MSPEENLWLAILRRETRLESLTPDQRGKLLRKAGFPLGIIYALNRELGPAARPTRSGR